MVSSEHWRSTPARVRRWTHLEMPRESTLGQRAVEMNGELRNTSPRHEEKLQIKDRECIALTTEQV